MEDLTIKVGMDEVNVRVEPSEQVWVHTDQGPGLGRVSREVSVEDVMALVHHLVKKMPVFSVGTFERVHRDVRTFEARKERDLVSQKVTELGVKYLGVDAAHLKKGERELIERLLAAEEGR